MAKLKPAPLPPDTMIGGYRVLRKLAGGGFGLVYLALDAFGLPRSFAFGSGMIVVVLLRVAAMRWRLHLPVFYKP